VIIIKKITVCIKDNNLLFKYRINKPVEPNLLNTNVISNEELIFSDDYILANSKIVSLFLNDLVKERNISVVTISNNELALLILPLLKRISSINSLVLSDDDNLIYSLCELITKNGNIKFLDCYEIPTFMIDYLDKYDIKVSARNEVLFTSKFMQEYNLDSISKIYYKGSLRISDMNNDDLEDFKAFMAINKYLRVIHLEKYDKELLNNLCAILKRYGKKKKIVVQIHDDINNPDLIRELRILNDSLKKKYKIKLNLKYSKDYLEKNYIKQVVLTTLTTCAIVILLIVGVSLGYVLYNNYVSEQNVERIKADIEEKLKDVEDEPIEVNPTDPYRINPTYKKLMEINDETVGWLKVNGTNIDYPLVQTTDNAYYLNNNYYKEADFNGWVFMDYRNNIKELDKNTIIYGHNRYDSGVMFGTLQNVRKASWRENTDNLYITFNTLYGDFKWKVFAYYEINVTNDYLQMSFDDDEEFMEFVNMLKNRSYATLNTEVRPEDKILTLSTCLDNNKRLVVHAVLIKDELVEPEVVNEEVSNLEEVKDE